MSTRFIAVREHGGTTHLVNIAFISDVCLMQGDKVVQLLLADNNEMHRRGNLAVSKPREMMIDGSFGEFVQALRTAQDGNFAVISMPGEDRLIPYEGSTDSHIDKAEKRGRDFMAGLDKHGADAVALLFGTQARAYSHVDIRVDEHGPRAASDAPLEITFNRRPKGNELHAAFQMMRGMFGDPSFTFVPARPPENIVMSEETAKRYEMGEHGMVETKVNKPAAPKPGQAPPAPKTPQAESPTYKIVTTWENDKISMHFDRPLSQRETSELTGWIEVFLEAQDVLAEKNDLNIIRERRSPMLDAMAGHMSNFIATSGPYEVESVGDCESICIHEQAPTINLFELSLAAIIAMREHI